jgi:adenylyltransferase/sulfurtransferase
VREPAEWEINRIDGAVLIPKSEFDAGTGADRLPPGRVVLYCKSGVRSAAVAETLRAAGVDDVVSLTGGILAWAQQFDPDMVSY